MKNTERDNIAGNTSMRIIKNYQSSHKRIIISLKYESNTLLLVGTLGFNRHSNRSWLGEDKVLHCTLRLCITDHTPSIPYILYSNTHQPYPHPAQQAPEPAPELLHSLDQLHTCTEPKNL